MFKKSIINIAKFSIAEKGPSAPTVPLPSPENIPANDFLMLAPISYCGDPESRQVSSISSAWWIMEAFFASSLFF